MSKAPTQPQLPLSRNGHLGLRRQRRVCGFCGFNVTINADRTMRVHGPKGARCIGSGVRWTPVFHTSRRTGRDVNWGTCGICGDVTEYTKLRDTVAEETGDSLTYLTRHNHERPHIKKDRTTGLWVVLVANHRTGKRLTIECDTSTEAHAKAVELIELQK